MIDRNSLDDLEEALREVEVSSNSIGTAVTILEKIGDFDPSEDLPKDPRDWFNGQEQYYPARSNINFIPGEKDGCHDLLITVCAGERNFDLNTMETIALCINCQPKIKAVIIATDYWNEEHFNTWRKPAFEALANRFSITFFIFTPHAGRWAFDQIVPSLAKKAKKRK